MSLDTYTLTVRANAADGTPIAGARVTAVLTKPDYTPYGGVFPSEISATADENGVATLQLVSNLVGTQNSLYYIVVRDASWRRLATERIQMPQADATLAQLVEEQPVNTETQTAAAISAYLAQAWAEGTEPGGAGTQSSREWAETAAQTVQSAITDIENARDSALATIDTAETDTLTAVNAARDQGVQAVQAARDQGLGAVQTARDDAVNTITGMVAQAQAARDEAQAEATSAANSAASAQTAASSASNSETAAALSAANAAASEAAAAQSATLAEAWAEGTEPGGAGTMSAKEWAQVADPRVLASERIVSGTTYTLQPADAGGIVLFTGDDPAILTIEKNVTQNLPARTTVEVVQAGNGTVTIGAVTGVTLQGDRSTEKRDATLSLYQREALDTWHIFGGVFSGINDLFATGHVYGWAIVAPDTVWADTAGTVPGVVNQTIRRLDDQRGAPWIGATTGPTYRVTAGINWLEFAQTNGRQLNITVPAITNGTLMVAHKNAGVLSGNVTIPAGTYSVGRWDSHGIVGIFLIDRDLSQAEREQVRQWFVAERGAGSFVGSTAPVNTFAGELKLISVDLFDTSSWTIFWGFLYNNKLTTVPLFDTSSGTNFYGFLQGNQLATVPLFDTSNGTNFEGFLYNNKLTTVPLFDTSNGTNFQGFLQGNQLATVPLFDTSNGTNFQGFLYNNKLTTVPLFDTSSGTNFYGFLQGNQLATVPLFDTSNGTSFQDFCGNNLLTTLPLFDTSSGTIFIGFCRYNKLANVPAGLFDNVKGNNFTNAFLNCALTQQSVDNVLVSIATAAAANNLNNGTLTGLDSGTNAAPSATGVAAKNALIARGWTVTTF